MKWLITIFVLVSVVLVTGGILGWVYYKNNLYKEETMIQAQEEVEELEAKSDIVIEGSTYTIAPPRSRLKDMQKPTTTFTPTEVVITAQPSVNNYKASESGEVAHTVENAGIVNAVTLSSLEDIYVNFPFLREKTLTPEAALLHARLIVSLSGDEFSVIKTTPDQASIDGWYQQFEKNKTSSYESWLRGPYRDDQEPSTLRGNVNWANIRPPNYGEVTAPRQENGSLTYYILYKNNSTALPQKVFYFPGTSPTHRSEW